MDFTWARPWHLVTAALLWFALVLQFVLVVDGQQVLVEEDAPTKAESIYRFFAYFTIQSNLLGAIGVTLLVRDPAGDGRWLRVIRIAGVVGLFVTALVHFFLLRPLLDLDGLSYLCDKLLHMVSPALVVVGWLAFGPRPRVSRLVGREVGWALGWVLLWTVWTMVVGATSGWFPYPFMNYEEEGWASVLVVLVGVTVLVVAVFVAAAALDRRMPPRPERDVVSG